MSTFKKNKGISWQDFGEGMVVLNPHREKVHEFNQTAAFLWKQMDQSSSQEELASALSDEFEVDLNTAIRDVSTFIEQSHEWGLIE